VVLEWGGNSPTWLSPELEPYLGATTFLGTRSRVLDEGERLVEFNLALEKQAWKEARGFLGMEQFGTSHLAAGEGLLLFKRLRRMGCKLAFVSEAVMWHHVGSRANRGWMLRRGYWQGVNNVLLTGIEKPGPVSLRLASTYLAQALGRLARAAAHSAQGNTSAGMVQLTYAASYLGQMVAQLHLVGDWRKIKTASAEASDRARVIRSSV